MKQTETSLEMAQRHVVESEARCTRQTDLLREMITGNHPEAARVMQRVLAASEDSLDVLREHLIQEEKRVAPDPAA